MGGSRISESCQKGDIGAVTCTTGLVSPQLPASSLVADRLSCRSSRDFSKVLQAGKKAPLPSLPWLAACSLAFPCIPSFPYPLMPLVLSPAEPGTRGFSRFCPTGTRLYMKPMLVGDSSSSGQVPFPHTCSWAGKEQPGGLGSKEKVQLLLPLSLSEPGSSQNRVGLSRAALKLPSAPPSPLPLGQLETTAAVGREGKGQVSFLISSGT